MASVTRTALTQYLNELLKPETFKDYCPNGLQVEGKAEMGRLVAGVTASQALLDAAVPAVACSAAATESVTPRAARYGTTSAARRRPTPCRSCSRYSVHGRLSS